MSDIPRFGASDFFLVQTDAAQLREQLRATLADLLGRPVVDADPHMVLASSFLPYLVQGQASADACAKATLRAYAVGQDLDRIADSTCVVGYLDRRPARGAVLAYLLTFTLSRTVQAVASECEVAWTARRAVTLDDGTELSFEGAGTFAVSFALTDGLTKSIVMPVYLVCTTPGLVGNGVFADALAAITDADAAVELSFRELSSVSEEYSADDAEMLRCGCSYNGADTESDEAFAERVAWQAKALRVSGSLEYFKLALSDLPLLASSYIAPTVDDQGRIVIAWCDKANYIAQNNYTLTGRGAAYDAFIEAVRASLLVEQRAYVYAAGGDPTVYTVVYKLPQNTIDVASARKAVESAWSRYVDAHAWHCGALLRVNDMLAAVTDAGASVATVRGPTQTLPADCFIPASQFYIEYEGLSVDELAPGGSSGEEVTP